MPHFHGVRNFFATFSWGTEIFLDIRGIFINFYIACSPQFAKSCICCIIFKFFYVKSCAKCHKFGYYHADCNTNAVCGFCLSNKHKSKDCPAKRGNDLTSYRCVNCKERGKEFQGYSSHWHKCPVHLEQQKKIRNSIPYYPKS